MVSCETNSHSPEINQLQVLLQFELADSFDESGHDGGDGGCECECECA